MCYSYRRPPLSLTVLGIIDRTIEDSDLMFCFHREAQDLAEDAVRRAGLEEVEGTEEHERVFRIVKCTIDAMEKEKFI